MRQKITDILKKTKLDRLINGETIRFGIGGVATTLLNIGLYRVLLLAGMAFQTANLIAIVVAKIAAFFVNKLFVFRTHRESTKASLLEVFRYIYTRGFTMLVDYFGLILLVNVLGGDERYMKYITTVVVVIINYLLGKFLVFRKRNAAGLAEGQEEQA